MRVLDALKGVSLFEGLSKRELNHVLKEAKEEIFSPGQDIMREGGKGGRFVIVMEGRVKVFVGGRARRVLGPGSHFGEISLIDGGTRSATVRAETNVKALTIASWNFLSMLDTEPALSRKVMKGLCARIRSLDKSYTG